MKRKLFFLLDRLQIDKSERIAVTALMISAMVLSSLLVFSEPRANYDPAYYAELEQVFNEKSEAYKSEYQAIMARYEPEAEKREIDEEIVQQIAPTPVEINTTTQQADTARININTATAEELQQLPGIGPAYSERIVEWREENGEFSSKDQLLEIRGIGPARLEQIRDLISL